MISLKGNGLLENPVLLQQGWAALQGVDMGQIRYDARESRLQSDLRITVERTAARGMVAISMNVAFGSLNDPKEQEGLSHWIEHLLFHVSPGHDSHTLAEVLTSIGATDVNAFTGPASTQFIATVPRKSLRLAMEALSKVFIESVDTVAANLIELERSIVLNQ